MNAFDQFLWVIFPYLMLSISVVGHIYRYKINQLNWSARSSEFLEKNHLRWGSILFHYGIIFVFFGHVAGLLIPAKVVSQLGITDEIYHIFAIYSGGAAGIIVTIGLLLLFVRRVSNERVSINSSFTDKFILILLLILIGFGLYNTLIYNVFFGSFNYRITIAPWLRSLIVFAPDAKLMVGVPLSYQIHVLLSFLIVGVWPFSRLVHIWSVPIDFLYRRNILYRKQKPISLPASSTKYS
ncbi:MAG: respiratory nitrate reductase subunit gamma [Candidatus Kryptoniota bacterium]